MAIAYGLGVSPVLSLDGSYQASGTSLSYVIPGGTLRAAGDLIKIWAVSNNGTSGGPTTTITVGGATIVSGVGGVLDKVIWEITIQYVTDTTALTAWSFEADDATNDCDFTNPSTVSSWASDSTFEFALTGGTSPDVEALLISVQRLF